MPIVEIPQRDPDSDFHVRAPSLTWLPKVSVAAEEAREHVEGVMVLAAAALLSLLQTFVAILVIDLAGLGVRERFVCLCHLYKLLLCGLISSANC